MKTRYFLWWLLFAACSCLFPLSSRAWGFFAHQRINRMAVFTLPPEMMTLYKANIEFIAAHAVDPDKLRYVMQSEGVNHFMDMDRYGAYPFAGLPRSWKTAVEKYSLDTLLQYGIVPWHTERVLQRLTAAFRKKDPSEILRLSAYLGHYVADLHVPLHAHSNYNGQFTGQEGIHALWESRIPELLADSDFDLFTGKAIYIDRPAGLIWRSLLESAAAADTVLRMERSLSAVFPPDRKYAFEEKNGVLVKNYSLAYVKAYTATLQRMVERRMRASVYAVACLWYTAWVNAGQPDLHLLTVHGQESWDTDELHLLNERWMGHRPVGRDHE